MTPGLSIRGGTDWPGCRPRPPTAPRPVSTRAHHDKRPGHPAQRRSRPRAAPVSTGRATRSARLAGAATAASGGSRHTRKARRTTTGAWGRVAAEPGERAGGVQPRRRPGGGALRSKQPGNSCRQLFRAPGRDARGRPRPGPARHAHRPPHSCTCFRAPPAFDAGRSPAPRRGPHRAPPRGARQPQKPAPPPVPKFTSTERSRGGAPYPTLDTMHRLD